MKFQGLSLFRRVVVPALLMIFAVPLAAQGFSDGYLFLKAVKDSDGAKVQEMLGNPATGPIVVNSRERDTGRTGLHLVVERRDATWLNFLLGNGANPEIGDKKGETPLHLATQLNYIEGAKLLIAHGAKVDSENGGRETPLIRAVQLRNPEMVRILLNAGANPDITDAVAGLSAREYAERDNRAGEIATLIRDRVAKSSGDSAKGGKSGMDFSGALFE